MSRRIKDTGSLRQRLITQLMLSVAVLALVLNFTVRHIAEGAAETAQDNILGENPHCNRYDRPDPERACIDYIKYCQCRRGFWAWIFCAGRRT